MANALENGADPPRRINVERDVIEYSGYPCILYSTNDSYPNSHISMEDMGIMHASFVRSIQDKEDEDTLWSEVAFAGKSYTAILWSVDHESPKRYYATLPAFKMLRNTYKLVTTNVLKKVSQETTLDIVQLEQADADMQTGDEKNEEEITTSEVAPSSEPLEEINENSDQEGLEFLQPTKINLRNKKQVGSYDPSDVTQVKIMGQKLQRVSRNNEEKDKTIKKLDKEKKEAAVIQAETKQKLDQAEATKLQNAKEIAALEEVVRELREEISRVSEENSQVSALMEENTRLSASCQQWQSEKEKVSSEKIKTDSLNQELASTLQQQHYKIGNLQENFNTCYKDRQAADEEIAHQSRKNEKLVEVTRALQAEIKGEKDKREELQREFQRKCQNAKEQINTLQEELNNVKTENTDLKDDNTQLLEDKNKLSQENENLREKVNKMQHEIHGYVQLTNDLGNEAGNCAEVFEKLNKEIQDLKHQNRVEREKNNAQENLIKLLRMRNHEGADLQNGRRQNTNQDQEVEQHNYRDDEEEDENGREQYHLQRGNQENSRPASNQSASNRNQYEGRHQEVEQHNYRDDEEEDGNGRGQYHLQRGNQGNSRSASRQSAPNRNQYEGRREGDGHFQEENQWRNHPPNVMEQVRAPQEQGQYQPQVHQGNQFHYPPQAMNAPPAPQRYQAEYPQQPPQDQRIQQVPLPQHFNRYANNAIFNPQVHLQQNLAQPPPPPPQLPHPQLQNVLQNALNGNYQVPGNPVDYPAFANINVNMHEPRGAQANNFRNAATPPQPAQLPEMARPYPAQQLLQPQLQMPQPTVQTVTTTKELNDFDPYLVFYGRLHTIDVYTWFKRLEATFKPDWDEVKKIRRAVKHLDSNNPEFKFIKQSDITSYANFKKHMITTFGKNKLPFNLAKWTEACRYNDTPFCKWMSSQLGLLLIEKTAPRWDAGDLTIDEISIIMTVFAKMVPKRVVAAYYTHDRSWDATKLLALEFWDLLTNICTDEDINPQDWDLFNKKLPNPDDSENYKLNSLPHLRNKPKPQSSGAGYVRTDFNLGSIANTGKKSPDNQRNTQQSGQVDRRPPYKGKKNQERKSNTWNYQQDKPQQQRTTQYQQGTQQQQQQQQQQQRQQQPQRGGYQGYVRPSQNENQQRSRQENQEQRTYNNGNRRGSGRPFRGNGNRYKRGGYQRRVNLLDQQDYDEYEDCPPMDYDPFTDNDPQDLQLQRQGIPDPNRQQTNQGPKNGQMAPAGGRTLNVGVLQTSAPQNRQ